MRLFVAITPDYDAQRAIGQYVAAFLAGRVQTPVIPENLHVTLRFIGEVSAARLPEIERALSGVEMQAPSIAIEAVAAFPQRKPHTVVGLLARDAGLIALVDAVNAALEPIVPLRKRGLLLVTSPWSESSVDTSRDWGNCATSASGGRPGLSLCSRVSGATVSFTTPAFCRFRLWAERPVCDTARLAAMRRASFFAVV